MYQCKIYIFLGGDFIQFGGEVRHTMTSSYSETSTLGNAQQNYQSLLHFYFPRDFALIS